MYFSTRGSFAEAFPTVLFAVQQKKYNLRSVLCLFSPYIVNGSGARRGLVSVLTRNWCTVCATGKTRVVLILLLCCNIASVAYALLIRVLL